MSFILQNGSKGEEVVLLQRALNELGKFALSKDGAFGPGTRNALITYQQRVGLPATGTYDPNLMTEVSSLIDAKYIRDEMIGSYADNIGIKPNFLRAIVSIESSGAGFFNNGQCVILFERHIFFNQAVRKFGRKKADEWAKKYPNVCNSVRSQSAYFGGVREWDRLDQAKNLDPECALLSASYGLFQIMGFNYNICGYSTVGDYVADACESEQYQIGALAMFIKNQRGMLNAAKSLNFNEFARLYNGSAYASHGYHTRLKNAYDKFSKG